MYLEPVGARGAGARLSGGAMSSETTRLRDALGALETEGTLR